MLTANIKGLDELQRRLEGEGPRARKILWSAAKKAGAIFRDTIKSLVPTDTGTLADSIRMSWRSLRGDQLGGAMFIGPDRRMEPKSGMKASHVASWLEFGTRKMAPRPFMSQGFEMAKGNALNVFISELKRLLNISDTGGGETIPNSWDEPGSQTGNDKRNEGQ